MGKIAGMIPQVQKQEAINFAKQWNYNGVAIPTDDITCQFATDFANVCLLSFVQYCNQKAVEAMQKAKEAEAAKKVII